ncbi:hypothetical protein OF820_11010 [Oceanotoga sp. DSM 15011]|uniref:TolB family protein n=1 Tax=Oceanotoga sp. DSM 15011 TaxID=2984951 RepID=UPI0021F42C0C|nr:hypothetical protein [Oceanotoga sp. DSM 15011]UYO99590.1 hypothetical protein OF820_11010 [Oceanotoga sp. DSM 15011]
MRKYFIILFVILISFIGISGIIYQPPADLYFEETEHFKFIFEKDLKNFFYEVKDFSEYIYSEYSEFYGVSPEKIKVYILDDVDYTNSFANGAYNFIRLYINPPQDSIGLGDNVTDWLKFVFTHELNHVFYGNLIEDPILKIIPSDTIKKLIGGLFIPSYMHEGVSIYMESKYFNGRYRDDIFNMYLKQEVLSKDYPRYYYGGGANIDIYSPAGFNYMYGALITKNIYIKYGEEVLKLIIKDLNSSVLNTISESFEDITGDNWNEFLFDIKKSYKNLEIELKNKGYNDKYYELEGPKYNTGNLKASEDHIYYFKNQKNDIKGLYKDDILIKKNISNFDVSKNDSLIYTVGNKNDNYVYSLYFDCNCPNGDRFIDDRVISFSFVGENNIVYSKLNKGQSALILYDIKNKNKKVLKDYSNIVFNYIESYENKLYISMNINNISDIYMYDLSEEKFIKITDDEYKELNLFAYENYLYYSSNKEDGIYNIYRMDLNDFKTYKLTNSISGAFNPIIYDNKIYYLVYEYDGYHIAYKNLNDFDYNIFYQHYLKDYEFEMEFESLDLENKELNKYYELPKFSVFPYLEYEKSEDKTFYGIDLGFMSEAMNYSGDFILLYDFDESFKFDSMIQFDFYTHNKVYFNYYKGYNYGFNISDDYEFYNGLNKFLFIPEIGIDFVDYNFNKVSLKNNLIIDPYSINHWNIYTLGFFSLFEYDKTLKYSLAIDKPFILYDIKLDPLIGYRTIGDYNELFFGGSIEKDLLSLNWSIFDGKFRLDKIILGGSFDYGTFSKLDYKIYLKFNSALFYWIDLDIPFVYPW